MRCSPVLWSTPDAPAEEVEACDYSHAGSADTEGQLHSFIIAFSTMTFHA